MGMLVAITFTAFGQRNIKNFGRGDGIIKEQLVKITHAVKQQAIRMRSFYCMVLRHHRRVPLGEVILNAQGFRRCRCF